MKDEVGQFMDIRKVLGIKIRMAREAQGITQKELAERLGKAKNVISTYESGTRAIRVTELPLLAEALGVTISYFFLELSIEDESRSLKPQHQRLLRWLLLWLKDFEQNDEEVIELSLQISIKGEPNDDIRTLGFRNFKP